LAVVAVVPPSRSSVVPQLPNSVSQMRYGDEGRREQPERGRDTHAAAWLRGGLGHERLCRRDH
jgi:hypothetical protein